MPHTGRPGLSAEQKLELWTRWKNGESLSDIGRALGKHAASVFTIVVAKGGIAPAIRRRRPGSLRVRPNGAKQWVQRITIRGKRSEIGLGSPPAIPLATARKLALEHRGKAMLGGDPLADRRKAASVLTFEQAVEHYLANKLDEFRNEKHRKQWRSTLDTYANPILGPKRVSEVTMQDVLRVLEPIWQTKTETAKRLRGRIENVLSWAADVAQDQKSRRLQIDSMIKSALDQLVLARPESEWELLGTLVETRYGTSISSDAGAESGVAVLRIPNVIGGEVDTTDLKYVDLAKAELKRLSLTTDDVLIVRSNGNPDPSVPISVRQLSG